VLKASLSALKKLGSSITPAGTGDGIDPDILWFDSEFMTRDVKKENLRILVS
jgi:hypothetical protein